MNFDFNSIEEKEAGNYLSHGVHKVKITGVEHKAVSTASYNGDAWDISIADSNGATSSIRMFPFQFSDKVNKYEKGKIVGPANEAEQWKSYQAKIKHLFTKALGEEIFDKTVKAAKDLKTLYKFLGQACEKYGKEFAIMLVRDKKGYAKMPLWENGYAAHLKNAEGVDGIERLKAIYTKDVAKFGPLSAPTTGEKPAATSADLNDLFNQINTPVSSTSPAAIAVQDDDDLPF